MTWSSTWQHTPAIRTFRYRRLCPPIGAHYGIDRWLATRWSKAKQAALAFCDRPPAMLEVPWFWTDQYDIRLMIAKSLTPDRDCIRNPYVSPKALAL